MKRSMERILTTHVGSLTRPVEIIDAMRARVNQEPYDRESFAQSLRKGVLKSCAGRPKLASTSSATENSASRASRFISMNGLADLNAGRATWRVRRVAGQGPPGLRRLLSRV